jgi:hypothetical protein
MGLSEKQMDHPRFWGFSEISNSVLETAFLLAGLDFKKLQDDRLRPNADRVVDQITALLLRVEKEG